MKRIVDFLAEELKHDGDWQRMVKRQDREAKRQRMVKLVNELRAKGAAVGR